MDPIEFIQRFRLRAPGPGDARERALVSVVELAAQIPDPIRLALLLERASQVFGFPEAVLGRAVALKSSGQRSDRPVVAAVREQAGGASRLERELLQALMQSAGRLDDARRRLNPEDFRDPACAGLARRLWSDGADAQADESASALARELAATATPETDWDRVAEGGIRRLIQRRLERQYKVAQQRIQDLQRRGLATEPETVHLLQQSQELARSISELNR